MEETIHIAKGYACKSAKFDKNQELPWLTHVQRIDVNQNVAQLEPTREPLVLIGRAFTRNLWSLGLLDDYEPFRPNKPPSTHNCVLNLLFTSFLRPYNLRVAFHYGERDRGRQLSVSISEKELSEFLFQRVIEGSQLYLAVEARVRYLLVLNWVSCTMNGLDLVVA